MEWNLILLTGIIFLKFIQKLTNYAESIRKEPRPVLLEFKTFRMRGHEEASGTKYVPKNYWKHGQQKIL